MKAIFIGFCSDFTRKGSQDLDRLELIDVYIAPNVRRLIQMTQIATTTGELPSIRWKEE